MKYSSLLRIGQYAEGRSHSVAATEVQSMRRKDILEIYPRASGDLGQLAQPRAHDLLCLSRLGRCLVEANL